MHDPPRVTHGRKDGNVPPDGDISPLDEAAVSIHEMYLSFRRAGFTRAEATSIIAKVTFEVIAQQQDAGDRDT